MALPGLAQVGRMIFCGAAASKNQRIRIEWNSFQNRLKYNTLLLCFAERPRAARSWGTLPFHFARILIDGIIGGVSVAFTTVLCVGVPIVVFNGPSIPSASSLSSPWSMLSQIQELIVRQAYAGSLLRSISIACVACASFVIEAFLGSPRLAMISLLPNINGIVPHRAFARVHPLDRAFARIRGVCISQILRASFFSFCLPANPSMKIFAAAVLAPLPMRMLGVFYLELGRALLHHYPGLSQLVTSTLNAPQVINEDEQGDMFQPELVETYNSLHHQLARTGLVFHSDHMPIAPIYCIHERVVSSYLLNPLVFNSELRSWYVLLQAFHVTDHEFPGLWKRLLLGFWFQGCAEMLQNGLIASSLVLNEIVAYLWDEVPVAEIIAPQR
jgi:hypothetical protein